MKRRIFFLLIMAGVMIFSMAAAFAEDIGRGKTLIYIPIDNRPVNLKQTVELAERLGYEVLVPPQIFLGTGADSSKFGNPEELWYWLNKNAHRADAAIISTDAVLYGSLVASRQHEMSVEEVLTRAKNFEIFHEDFPYLPIYAFGTIMRTPRSGSYSSAEPEYYKQFGEMILLETDSPYLAPVPNRGKRNEPSFVVDVAKKIAEIRGENLETVAQYTTENAERLYNIKEG